MAETPLQEQPATITTQQPSETSPDSLQYWCYQCEKRVAVETLANLPDVICYECKNGFVESIAAAVIPSPPSAPPSRASDLIDEPAFGNQFLQVLRLISQAARDSDPPPPPPSDHADQTDNDYIRNALDGWDNDDDDGDANSVEVRNGEEDDEDRDDDDDDDEHQDGDGSDVESEENENREERNEEDLHRRQRDALRLRLRDFAARAANRRDRILDWAEILMGLEDHSIELRLQMPQVDDYIGNPGDYMDAAGYEALLQNLAESDASGSRGAPPAAKSVVSALEAVEIKPEDDTLVCAICKDSVNVGESAKKLPCKHGYHEDCIVPWLGSRNTCPVCRFELPTDDPEYEEERKKRSMASAVGGSSSGGYDPGFE